MRSINEIESALDNSIASVMPNLSGSQFAEWRLWKSIFALSLWVFEGIMDMFKADIEKRVQTKQPGSFEWYHEKIKEFQGGTDSAGIFQGDNLVVKNGILQYEAINPARRVITQASLSAINGVLVIKLAKALDAENYQPLTNSEQIAFGLYFGNIKYPGTAANIISMAADLLKYDLQIVFNPVYTLATVQASVQAKLQEFRASMGFDDKVYISKLVEKIMEASGVVAVKRNRVQGFHASSGVWTEIDIVYTLIGGYFNYSVESALTFTNYKTL